MKTISEIWQAFWRKSACKHGHVKIVFCGVLSWFEYESELCYQANYRCDNCGERWHKIISSVEADRLCKTNGES